MSLNPWTFVLGGILLTWQLFLFVVSDNATVTFTIPSIAEVDFSGNPGTLTISSFTPGVATSTATNSTTTWALSTNLSSQKITGQLNTAMPTGLILQVALQAPSGATSQGTVSLSTTASNLVTNITKIAASGLTVTYTLRATAQASPSAATNRIVTFTIGS